MYNDLAGYFHKVGDLNENLFFAKIDGDQEKELVK